MFDGIYMKRFSGLLLKSGDYSSLKYRHSVSTSAEKLVRRDFSITRLQPRHFILPKEFMR